MNRQGAKVAKKEPEENLDRLAHEIIGAAIEVHRILGPGYLENVYEEALAVEFVQQNIVFERQKEISLSYKEHRVGQGRLDFLVGDQIVVELKTVDALADIHTAQLLSYLRTTGLALGLLINFNVPLLKNGIKRVVLS